MKTVYHGALEPLLLYNCSVWASGLKYKYNTILLNKIQRKIAIRISKLYKTVSCDTAIYLAGITPLHIKVKYFANLYDIKSSGEAHIENRNYVIDLPVAIHKKLPPCSVPLPSSVPHQNPDYTVYTDGSKSDSGVGAGFCIYQHDALIYTRQVKLHRFCSIFQAELVAIHESIISLSDLLATPSSISHPHINIFSDSQSCISAISDIHTKISLINKIHKALISTFQYASSINISWVRGHSGVEGNELADTIAKNASCLTSKPHFQKIPLSFIKLIQKNIIQNNASAYYQNIPDIKPIKAIFPTLDLLDNFLVKFKPTWTELQYITGHGHFNSYLHRFGLKNQDSCECCNTSAQTPHHLLLECPLFSAQRRHLFSALRSLRLTQPPTFADIFRPEVYSFTANLIKYISSKRYNI